MIGDTPSDFLAAREAGVPFLGYARNERKEKALREAGAGMMVGSLELVLQTLRG
jgi:phosphoglycolate phosphatase-like HAD superfamily hydrolase